MEILTLTNLILAVVIIILAELLLRLHNSSKKNLSFDITNYPFYRRPKNKTGRDAYNLERRGKELTPLVKTYQEGIRSKFPSSDKNIILSVGCSYTEGIGLKDSQTYPSQIQNLIDLDENNSKMTKNDSKEFVTINAGMGGYGPFQIARMVKDLIKYNPKIVLVQLLDFRRIPLNSTKIKQGKKEFEFNQKLKKVSLLLWYLFKIKPKKFNGVRAPYINRNIPKEELWELNKKYLDQIKETCIENKSKLLVFLWPNNNPEVLNQAYFQTKVKQYCEKNKIKTFDARKIYGHYTEKDLQLENDAHPSSLANQLIARATYQCLKKNRFLN